jgi:hypothetical protein
MDIKCITEQQFEDLAKRYPTLLEKSHEQSFGVGQGWYPIIETLCALISSDLDRAVERLSYAQEKKIEAKSPESVAEADVSIASWIPEVEKLKKEIPTILQVKEKFGSLRFYISGSNDKIRNYINFAEEMSMRTCECCGASGEPRNDGWVKTLCEKHHRERHLENTSDFEVEDFE